jgi:hypothetical protein
MRILSGRKLAGRGAAEASHVTSSKQCSFAVAKLASALLLAFRLSISLLLLSTAALL